MTPRRIAIVSTPRRRARGAFLLAGGPPAAMFDAMDPAPSAPVRGTALALLLAALVALAMALAWHTTGDLDLLLHDRVGRDLLAGRGLPGENHFSFTAPDHPWVDHAWAFQALVALAGDLAGGDAPADRVAGWQVLRLLLTALLVGVLIRGAWPHLRRPDRATLALAGPVALLTLALLWTRLTLRPELLSFALLALVVSRVEAALRAGAGDGSLARALLDPRRPGGQALLLTLVWQQCHGFAALSVVVWVLGGLLATPRSGRGPHVRLALGGAVLAGATGLLTPAGMAGLLHPLRVLGQFTGEAVDLQTTISELVPLLETRGSLALTVPLFLVSLAWGVLWAVATWGRVSRLRLALWLLAAVAAWQGQRQLGFYAVTFALLHAGLAPADRPTLAGRLGARLGAAWRPRLATAAAVALPAASVVVAGWWLGDLADDGFYLREGVARRWGGGLTPAVYPVAAADHARGRQPDRVANTVDAASALIARRTGPVAIDGRTEAYPPRVWRHYRTLRRGGEPALRQLARWRADAVVLAPRNAAGRPLLRTLWQAPRWHLVFADPAGVVLVPARPGVPDPGPAVLRQAAAGLARRLDRAPPGRRTGLADAAASLASVLQIAGQAERARTLLTAGLVRSPGHPVLLHNLGNVLLARGDVRGALPRFQAAARGNPAAAPPLVNAGTCLFRLGRLRDAADAFAAAAGRDPENFEAWANLAETRRRLGDRDAAAAAYDRALELNPGDRRLRARARSL